jgi:putative transposase
MSRDNSGWGAPRIHGELQMLGIHISQATVAKYMIHHPKPSSQTRRTILNNHSNDLVSVDFFTVPTATFRILYVFLVLRHEQREVIHFNVTEHPTAQWTVQQMVEAFP